MARPRIALVIGLAVAALAVAGCGGDDESGVGHDGHRDDDRDDDSLAATRSRGVSVPGFEISLTGPDGADVATLAAGTYTIEVDDQSDMHNFHLTGPGVEETTDVAGTGPVTWEVTLEAGTYNFVCDPHASTMNGSFEVSG